MPTSKNTARKYAAGGSSDNSCGVEPLRAVIYARYSSSGQREESIEGQLRDCYEFAKKHGIIVIGEYIDKAMTGRVDRRPDFQRMMKDSEKGRFNCVLLWKMDRFARNRYDSAMYKYKLKKNGIRIFYAKETIPDGPEGIILESVMEGYAEYYSENLAQNVKRGNYDSALELKTLGKTCLGLKTGPDGRYMIDQAEAAIVRRIFEEYAEGERAKDIYERLNSEGYRTSRGGKFNKNSLRRILSNKKYIGVYEYEDIYVENGIPAIITDRDLFERVQKMLKINHDAPARGKAQNFLLTTKLFCGLCGSPMIGDGGTSRTGKAYAYYSCTKRKRGRSCKKESVPKDWIEDLVVGELVKIVHNDELIEQIADRVMEYQKREKDQSGLHALEIRQKENEKAISNMLAAIEAGIITPSTKTRLMELEADRADIEKGIAHELLAEPEFERDQIIYFLERFRSGDINDEAYRIMLVDTFLNSVYLYDDDHLVLVMNYSGENCKVDLKLVEGAVSGDGCKGSAFAPSSALKTPCENHRGFFCAGRDLESGFKVSAPLRSVHSTMLSDLDKSVNCTLVKTIKEFKGMKANDVVKYIEGEPYVGIVPVEPGSTNAIFNDNSKIAGLNTENFEINEGLIRFDIIFYVRVPSKSGNNSNNENELSQVIINIEAQKDEPKKYQIINRAVFYISRLVSSQKQRDFINMNYDDIKKVYSIWVCMGMKENTMCHIHLTKDDLIGKHNWRGNLDLLNIVMIGISDTLPEHDNTYEMHRLLAALFTNTLNAKQKIDIINKEYDIPVESDIEEGVSIMCNLSQGIEEKALEKGRSAGIAEGRVVGIAQGKTSAQIDIILNMYNNNFTIEQIALATQYDVDKIKEIIQKN